MSIQSESNQQEKKMGDVIVVEEIFRPIPGFEGLYEVSNMARVRGIRRQQILKTSPEGWLTLCKRGIPKSFSVFKLVAKVFGQDHVILPLALTIAMCPWVNPEKEHAAT